MKFEKFVVNCVDFFGREDSLKTKVENFVKFGLRLSSTNCLINEIISIRSSDGFAKSIFELSVGSSL